MALSLGIVGLPNVGKSTLFQALTNNEVNVANYPFATIDPNVGVVEVPDERLEKLSQLFSSEKTVPTIVEFVDIAGLVKGANTGEGLGNKFLANIREVDAICHVVRAFENSDIIHVDTTVDPTRDIDTILTELALKDLDTVEKRLQSVEKEAKTGKKEAVAEQQALEEVKAFLSEGKGALQYVKEHPESAESLRHLQLLSAKPMLYLVNSTTGEAPEDVISKIEEQGCQYIVMDLKEEAELQGLSKEELRDLGTEPKLPSLIKKAYEVLSLITFFTAGDKETRAWTLQKGMRAPQAGGVIHSDFQEKFIKALVVPTDKLLEAGGYAQAASKGWLRTEGKEYVVQDGDVIEIKHGQ